MQTISQKQQHISLSSPNNADLGTPSSTEHANAGTEEDHVQMHNNAYIRASMAYSSCNAWLVLFHLSIHHNSHASTLLTQSTHITRLTLKRLPKLMFRVRNPTNTCKFRLVTKPTVPSHASRMLSAAETHILHKDCL